MKCMLSARVHAYAYRHRKKYIIRTPFKKKGIYLVIIRLMSASTSRLAVPVEPNRDHVRSGVGKGPVSAWLVRFVGSFSDIGS